MPYSPTRRQFVTRIAAAAAATGFWSELSAAASDSPNEKLNIGAIGVGNRGAVNLAAVKQENIVALCDVDDTFLARQKQPSQHPKAATYHDFRRLLDRRDLDAVLVSTPNHTHFPAARQALEAGLHVYCEKPLAHSVAELFELARLAESAKAATQSGNQHHDSPGYRLATAWVRAGKLGAIREVHCWTNRPLWPQGIERPAAEPKPDSLHWELWLGTARRRPFAAAYHPFKWRGFWEFGGGALGDMGPHLLDPVFRALKLSWPDTVQARSSGVNSETFPKWSVITFQFPARGERPPVRLTWYDGGQKPPREVTAVRQPPANGCLLLGEHGRLFIPELGRRPLALPAERGRRWKPPELTEPPSPGHHQQWLRAAKGGPPASCGFASVLPLTASCLLGNIALRVPGPLHWDAMKRTFRDHPAANQWLK